MATKIRHVLDDRMYLFASRQLDCIVEHATSSPCISSGWRTKTEKPASTLDYEYVLIVCGKNNQFDCVRTSQQRPPTPPSKFPQYASAYHFCHISINMYPLSLETGLISS